MPDVSIRAAAITTAPLDYKIPGAQEIAPKSVTASLDGTSAAGTWYPCLQVLDPAGNVMFSAISTVALAVGGTADVSWFPHLASQTPSGAAAGVIIDQFLVDSKTSTETSGSAVLTAGQTYTVTAQGTYSNWNSTLEVGTPNADAIFPSSTAGRASTQVGVDPECIFAFHRLSPADTLGHTTEFQFDTGSGLGYVTPQGGPFATPQTNYIYTYSLTGGGAVLKAKMVDTGPYTDNYGKVQVTVYSTSGSSSGGGGGALLPPNGADYAVLQPLSGVYSWNAALDGGSA